MNHRIAATLVLMAGYAVSSEPSEHDDKQKLIDAVRIAVGITQLIEGYDVSEEITDAEEVAQLAEQSFLESDDTEWWRCDDSVRFLLDDGCGEGGCPVKLAANHAMGLGMVTFAGRESYAQYSIQGLERHWDWCLQDDSFDCIFVLDAGDDGTYYDFTSASTRTRSDGRRITSPAGSFTCERSFPLEETS